MRVISEYGDREDGYLDCGIETVNGADVLIAVWDGEPARGKGGTADVVQYAESIGKPVMIIDADDRTSAQRRTGTGSSPATPCSHDLNALPDAAAGWSESIPSRRRSRLRVPAEMRPSREPRRAAVPAPDRGDGRARTCGDADRVPRPSRYGLHLLALPWLKLSCVTFALGGGAGAAPARCTRITAGCAAGSPRNSAARRSQPGGCRAPRRCCRTWTSRACAA